ncbi:MAG: DUF4398 domain-containing protein [Pseudomonadota bacterium]|nr:DUF4398 domain-containing protein [Pseudomonadota bacterium]
MIQTIQVTEIRQSRGSWLRLAAVAAVFLMFAACASTPEAPDRELQAAEMAITNAEQARVADYASPELSDARENLSAARRAVQQEEMVLAKRLAQQSRVNAELALAKAEALKAEAINDEMQKSTDALKQEMQRNSGDDQ